MRFDMPQVETKRLWLRPIEEMDALDIFEVYKNPNVTKFLSFPYHADIDITLCFIKTAYLPYEKRGVPQTWVIETKAEEKVIGVLSVHTIEDDIGEIGYVLHEDYWGKGIMEEALVDLIEVAFYHIGVRRLEAKYEVNNLASARVLKKCGFEVEGILRRHTKLSDNKYHDMVLCALLKDDWKEKHNEKRIKSEI